MRKHKTCSFIGHRKIVVSEKLKNNLKQIIIDLITKKMYLFFYLVAVVNLTNFAI